MHLTFEEIMDFDKKRNREVYDDLLRHYRAGKVMPFIGAGMSVAAGFDTWDLFLKHEYSEFMDGNEKPEDPLDAASELYKALGAASFHRDILRAFGGHYSESEWAAIVYRLQNEAAGLLPKLFHDVIVTTNFDRMLEYIYPSVPVTHPGHAGQLNRALLIGKPMILKLHGCVSEPENIILTHESYERAYPSEGSKTEVVIALEKILTSQITLFLGCSLKDDYTVRQWRKMISQRTGEGIEHFTIINCTPEERQSRRSDLGHMNVFPILYHSRNHDAVRVVLEQLYKDTNGGQNPSNLKRRYEFFTGREDDLKSLRDGFHDAEHITQVISGFGGIGKTQIALEYAHRHVDEYSDGVWWLDAENEVAIMNSCREILTLTGAIDNESVLDIEPDELLNRWQYWLREHKNRLLIYDNAERAAELAGFIPKAHHGHILLTTREANWDGKPTLGLSPMSKPDAAMFLQKRTGRKKYEERAGVEDVADRLGYLPLALEQAAAYMLSTMLSFTVYLNRLSRYGLASLGKDYAKPNEEYYKKIVSTTWQVSFDLIDMRSKSVGRLFRMFAYVESSNIPLDVFMDHRSLLPDDLGLLLSDELSIDDMVALLRQFSLIERDGGDDRLISIHRLVQEVVRDALARDADTAHLGCCFNVFFAAIPNEYGGEHKTRVLFERIAVHAAQSAVHYSEYNLINHDIQEKAASLLHWVGVGYRETSHLDLASDSFSKVLAITERALGLQHPYTATTYNNLALVYSAKGEFSKALELYGMAFAIIEKVLGVEHPDTANAYNNLALAYSAMGNFPEALKLYDKALAIKEHILGLEHPDTADTYNNMAVVYDAMGDYTRALELYGKSLAIKQHTLGSEHPDIATICNNMATVYHTIGSLRKALELHDKALGIKEKALGVEHSSTATTYSNIASVYHDLGEYRRALDWGEKAVSIYGKTLGLEHHSAAIAYSVIAAVYHAQGDYSEALEWHEKALVVREKTLGFEHPFTATTYGSIAMIYRAQGEYRKALQWCEKALTIQEKVLGLEHPDTATTYNNMAIVHRNIGEYLRALEWYEKAVAIFERTFGLEHATTAFTYSSMATVYKSLGDYRKALEWHGKSLAICEKILGLDHPSTLTACSDMAMTYHALGNFTEALKLYYRVLGVREEILGIEHPTTATVYNNIAAIYCAQGEYTKALTWFERALTIKEKVLGLEHPDTAAIYSNMATIYRAQGELSKALEWYKKAHAVLLKAFEPNHQHTISVELAIQQLSKLLSAKPRPRKIQ